MQAARLPPLSRRSPASWSTAPHWRRPLSRRRGHSCLPMLPCCSGPRTPASTSCACRRAPRPAGNPPRRRPRSSRPPSRRRLPLRQPAPRPPQPPGRIVKLTTKIGSQSTDTQKGWLGVRMDTLELPLALALGLPNANGALILEAAANSPAGQGGLRFGDIVVALNGRAITHMNELRQRVASMAPGTNAELEVWRVTTDGGDFLQTLRRLADGGNAHVMFRLGRMYATGIGVARDDAEAVSLVPQERLRRQLERKNVPGGMVLEGRGVAKDQQEGVRLLREAADKDNQRGDVPPRRHSHRRQGRRQGCGRGDAPVHEGGPRPATCRRCWIWPCCTTLGTAWRPTRPRRRRGTSGPPISAARPAWSTSASCTSRAGAWSATTSPRWPSTERPPPRATRRDPQSRGHARQRPRRCEQGPGASRRSHPAGARDAQRVHLPADDAEFPRLEPGVPADAAEEVAATRASSRARSMANCAILPSPPSTPTSIASAERRTAAARRNAHSRRPATRYHTRARIAVSARPLTSLEHKWEGETLIAISHLGGLR